MFAPAGLLFCKRPAQRSGTCQTTGVLMRFRPLPGMTILCLMAVAVLILFGNWQWSRYQEKTASAGLAPVWTEISGTWLAGSERIVYAYVDGQSAWRVVKAFETGDGIVFVPLTIDYAANPPEAVSLPAILPVSLKGTWRRPGRAGLFSAPDDPGAGIFYTFDPRRLGADLAPEVFARLIDQVFEPQYLTLSGQDGDRSVANPVLLSAVTERLPPERHFGYAITWWGLAIALVGVYLAFHHQRGLLRFRQERNR